VIIRGEETANQPELGFVAGGAHRALSESVPKLLEQSRQWTMNVVSRRLQVSPEQAFDLVIGTRIFI
jgi:hypothetical protein